MLRRVIPKRSWLAVAGFALVCLPCLLPVLAALTGVAALSALGGWLTDNATMIGVGATVALASFGLAGFVLLARRRALTCRANEPDPARVRGPT